MFPKRRRISCPLSLYQHPSCSATSCPVSIPSCKHLVLYPSCAATFCPASFLSCLLLSYRHSLASVLSLALYPPVLHPYVLPFPCLYPVHGVLRVCLLMLKSLYSPVKVKQFLTEMGLKLVEFSFICFLILSSSISL